MRQRKSHPPFVVKTEAGYEIETEIVSLSALLYAPWINLTLRILLIQAAICALFLPQSTDWHFVGSKGQRKLSRFARSLVRSSGNPGRRLSLKCHVKAVGIQH
jgi:hypothetical protein